MLMEFFKKLEKSKWLPLVGMSPFIIFLLLMVLDGEAALGVGIFAVFASAFVAVLLCGKLGAFIAERALKASENLTSRIAAAFSAFGFLFLPVLVGTYTNANMGTDIDISSIGAHFLWACCGAVLFFSVSPSAK